MTKESSLQNLAIVKILSFEFLLFVKEVCYVVKILHKYNGLRRNNTVQNIFIISLKGNIVFAKLLVTSFANDIFASFTEFQLKGTDTFGSTRVLTFEIYIQGSLLHK